MSEPPHDPSAHDPSAHDPGAASVVSESSWVGRVIDERYRIESVLDEGGMGAVFVAEHLKLGKSVAFKVILPKLAGDPELAQRFAREGMVSAQLDHPHIASAIDMGTLPDGGAYLVMQLARGRGLRAYLHGRVDWRVAAQLGLQIADALAVAHGQGIVHRDLKPENVKVEDRDGTLHVRVLDFGIARVSDSPASGPLTRVGAIMGTPGYMAPEQAVGETVDARADVYALGVILWELAMGRTLFDQDDFGSITAAQFTTIAPRLQDELEGVPAELDALVSRMLQSDKNGRPASGAEVRDVLRGLVLSGSIALSENMARSANVALASTSSGSAPDAAPPSAHAPTSLAGSFAVGTAVDAGRAGGAAPTWIPSKPPRGALLAAGAGALVFFVIVSCVLSRLACAPANTAGPIAGSPVPSAPSTAPETPADGVPAALVADAELLCTSPDDAARAAAAARLAPRQGELPAYLRMVLAYATSSDCAERRDAIRGLRALRDRRALPALYAIADAERRGDRCLRRDLDRTIDVLLERD